VDTAVPTGILQNPWGNITTLAADAVGNFLERKPHEFKAYHTEIQDHLGCRIRTIWHHSDDRFSITCTWIIDEWNAAFCMGLGLCVKPLSAEAAQSHI
jgi:hypothetical protein